MSIERQRAILEQQLEELTDGIMDLKRNRGENFSIKQLEKSKKSVKQKLEKLNAKAERTMLLPLKNSVWTGFLLTRVIITRTSIFTPKCVMWAVSLKRKHRNPPTCL